MIKLTSNNIDLVKPESYILHKLRDDNVLIFKIISKHHNSYIRELFYSSIERDINYGYSQLIYGEHLTGTYLLNNEDISYYNKLIVFSS